MFFSKAIALFTALPKPPITECSSIVTISLLSKQDLIASTSNGFIVWKFNILTLRPSVPSIIGVALIACSTMVPVAIIVIS